MSEAVLDPRIGVVRIPRGEGPPRPARLVFRFGIGVAELAAERLAAALRAVAAYVPELPSAKAAPPSGPADSGPIAPHHVVIGVLATTPRALAAAAARLAPAAGRARRLAARAAAALARLPGAGRLGRRADVVRDRAAHELERLAATGRREETEGRALAQVALVGFFEVASSRVAESPDLKRVIAEQSESLTVAAVTELREGSRRADGFVEAFARRMVRFGRRRDPGRAP